uniref:Retrotransposon protein, putative, Ty3-gypsy subclass n=1 Tax=Oryza sativa subsp. japonica TaxID=39947 RepID=Q2QTH6_ORYSJ|nr:retrotransposon protein, putative, Ty3-gypsy subclass [Oryza sativa Japonica Group]
MAAPPPEPPQQPPQLSVPLGIVNVLSLYPFRSEDDNRYHLRFTGPAQESRCTLLSELARSIEDAYEQALEELDELREQYMDLEARYQKMNRRNTSALVAQASVKSAPGLEWYIPGLEIELCSREWLFRMVGPMQRYLLNAIYANETILYHPLLCLAFAYLLRGLLSMSYTHLAIIHHRSSTVMLKMPRFKPEYLFGTEGFVQELRTMSFAIGFGTAPLYAQIPHDRDEEKCRVKVTLNTNHEDIPSLMFEAGGGNYIHACQEVARIAIGELRDCYSDQLADTEYRYHPRQPQGSDRGSYLEPAGIENDATTRHLVEMLWAMDEFRAEIVLAAQDREDRNRGKICKLEDKVDRLEKELAALKGEAPPQKARVRLTTRKRALFVPRYQLAPKVRVVEEEEVVPVSANPSVVNVSDDDGEESKRTHSKVEWGATQDDGGKPNEPSINSDARKI